MPEGPEVRCVAESLNRHLSGKQLINFGLTEKSRYHAKGQFKGMHLLGFNLHLQSVNVRGKRIIFIFRTHTGQLIYMLSFLGMEGHWLQYPTQHTAFWMMFGNVRSIDTHDIITGHKVFYYEDSRHFGSLDVFSDLSELAKALKNVGPDLLNEDVPIDLYRKTLRNSRIASKEIAWFMLEQKYFSGVGNYLRSEILYEAKIAPHRLIGTLTEEEIQLLHYISIKVLHEAYKCHGLTIASYVDPDGIKGTYVPKVYQQAMDPLGNSVSTVTLSDGRTTHWVPNVQS